MAPERQRARHSGGPRSFAKHPITQAWVNGSAPGKLVLPQAPAPPFLEVASAARQPTPENGTPISSNRHIA
jgi:hypothetical protein